MQSGRGLKALSITLASACKNCVRPCWKLTLQEGCSWYGVASSLFRFIEVHQDRFVRLSHAPPCFVRRIEESRKAFSALSSFLSRLRIRSNRMELWKATSDSTACRPGFFPANSLHAKHRNSGLFSANAWCHFTQMFLPPTRWPRNDYQLQLESVYVYFWGIAAEFC